MDMMMRRRAMMGAASRPSGPLYQLEQGSFASYPSTVTITNAHIEHKRTGDTSGVSRYFYVNGSEHKYGQSSKITNPWFPVHVGDTITLKVKNLTRASVSSSGSNFTVSFYWGTSSAVSASYAFPPGSGTSEDVIKTSVVEADGYATCFHLYSQRKGTISFDLELWVNNIRYL